VIVPIPSVAELMHHERVDDAYYWMRMLHVIVVGIDGVEAMVRGWVEYTLDGRMTVELLQSR